MSKFKIGAKIIHRSSGEGVIISGHKEDRTWVAKFKDFTSSFHEGNARVISKKKSNKKKAEAIAKEWGNSLEDLLQALEDGSSYSITQANQMQNAAAIIKALISSKTLTTKEKD